MLYAVLLLLLVEPVLQIVWNARYCSSGIVLFNQRIAAPVQARARLTLNSLERDLAQYAWPQLVFHPLPDGSVAFRESYGMSYRRYYPAMRGRIVVDARRNEVRVLGLCNWTMLGVTLLVLAMAVIKPDSAPMLLFLPVFGLSYWIQRRRFMGVVELLREQMAADRSVDALMAAHAYRQQSRL